MSAPFEWPGMTLFQRIKALFALGEQGAWYDPSDFSTMWQDSAGTTPVTAVEQPVGLVLDKSKGLVLGAELVASRDLSGFSNNALTVLTSTSMSGSISTGAYITLFEIGRFYELAISATSVSGTFSINTSTGAPPSARTEIGIGLNKTFRFLADRNGLYLRCNDTASASGVAISVRELPGAHSKQATAAARPVLRASPTRIDYDAVDDTLVATFASSLGTDCTVCRAVPGVGASILTAQTIGTSYTDSTDHCGLIIVNRALTASETASVTAYLNAKAGV
jgi:hypothetical protein